MHFLTCPKGCIRHAVRYTNGFATFAVPGTYGPEHKTARQVAVPPAMHADYDKMVALTPLRDHPPALEFYDDLHGVGGMFIPQAWAIIVGVKDQAEIAARVRRIWPTEVAQLFRQVHGRLPAPGQLVPFVFDAAVRRCMAHELGHALIRNGSGNPYAPDEEAGADYYAGRFDAALGRMRNLGAMFFYSIGCVGPSCTHPEPDVRAEAHGAGFDHQRGA